MIDQNLFFDCSRNVAMATNFLTDLYSACWRSKMDLNVAFLIDVC